MCSETLFALQKQGLSNIFFSLAFLPSCDKSFLKLQKKVGFHDTESNKSWCISQSLHSRRRKEARRCKQSPSNEF